MDAVKKGGLQLCVCVCRRRKNEWVFKFSYVINASSIIIEYVTKCLARHHIREIREIRERKKLMVTQIAQITQIFMLLAAAWGVCIAVSEGC